jgi:tetratricopeptide (TPR) repeat protein
MKKIIYVFLLLMAPFAAFSQGYDKELGDAAYAESNFNDAIKIYEAVIAEQGVSLPLYYNLGNAYYRANQPGKAILNYERALKIDANDEDTKANLEFVQSKIVDKIPQDDVPFFKEWSNAFFNLFTKDVWGFIGVVSFMIMLVMLFWSFFKKGKRNIPVIIFVISLIFTIIANVSAYSLGESTTKAAEGVILDEMVIVKSSPDSSGTELTKIHEGLKVMIVDDTLADWVKIEANNGNRVIGWIKTKSMERI